MADELKKVKQAILTWTYNTLNSKFGTYFKITENKPNVYWSETMQFRPVDATECFLDLLSDDSESFGVDGAFYYNETDHKYYNTIEETHVITINFAVSSMKSESLGLSALQAQNLAYEACSYIRRMLKSSSSSDYFSFDNEIITPILVLSQNKNISSIEDTSDFEETRGRHTCQFSCKFRYDVIDTVEAQVAVDAQVTLEAQNIEYEFNIDE